VQLRLRTATSYSAGKSTEELGLVAAADRAAARDVAINRELLPRATHGFAGDRGGLSATAPWAEEHRAVPSWFPMQNPGASRFGQCRGYIKR